MAMRAREIGRAHKAVLDEIERREEPFTVAEVAQAVGCHEAYARRVLDRQAKAGRLVVAEVAAPAGGRPPKRWRKVA